MAGRIIADLVRTMQSYFRIGDIRIKDNSGAVEARNADDSAYANFDAHTVELHGSNATNGVSLTAPAGLGTNVSLTLPNSVGSPGYVLTTDGATGALGWVAPISNGQLVEEDTFSEATISGAMFTPPVDTIITMVQVDVQSAASAGSPTISIGIASDPDRDMDELYSDLTEEGMYEARPNTDVGSSPDPIIMTVVPDGQTFSGLVRVWYVNPS